MRSAPLIPVTASTTINDPPRLATTCAASRATKLSWACRLAEMIMATGSIATCDATMKIPANSASAASFDRKTSRLDTGSASSTRKSVSSGNSEWLTSSVAKATTSIGSAMTSVSIAARYGAGVSDVRLVLSPPRS